MHTTFAHPTWLYKVKNIFTPFLMKNSKLLIIIHKINKLNKKALKSKKRPKLKR
ncbi:MAG: hypothetical protein KAI83_16535 [Thiomargarita sp.]|nr:hypothetical protein [Thiomargarita sp.]